MIRKLLVVLVGALLSSVTCFAQETKPEFTVVTVYTVRPEMRSEFEAAQKEVTEAYRRAGAPSRVVSSTLLGNLLEYVATYPIGKIADLDDPDPMVRALGQVGAEKLVRRYEACITDARRFLTVGRPDIGYGAEGATPGAILMWSLLHAAPGRRADLESALANDVAPAYKKIGVKHFWVSDVLFGGDWVDLLVVVPVESMASPDAGPPLTRALGPAGAQRVVARLSSMVASDEFRVLKVRPELSLLPTPAAR
jgi:hypothetical protein